MINQWLDQASCRGLDTNIFMPLRGGNTNVAKKICAGCPVKTECLEYSLRQAQVVDLHGVFGGLSKKQRYALMRSLHMSVRGWGRAF